AVAPLLLADAHALGIVAVRTERRGAGGADPFAPALMPLPLLRQALAQGFHQPFPTAERFDQLFFFLAQKPLRNLAQPGIRDPGLRAGQGLDPLEAVSQPPL